MSPEANRKGRPDDASRQWKQLFELTKEEIGEKDLEGATDTALAALEIAETFNPDDRRQGITLEMLTEALFLTKNYDLCAPFMVRLLQMYKRCLGPEHLDTGTIMHNLAILYQMQGRLDLAERGLQKTIEIKARSLGAHSAQVNSLRQQMAAIKVENTISTVGEQSGSRPKLSRTGQHEAFKPEKEDKEFKDVFLE